MPKEQMGVGLPKSAEQQTLLRVKELSEEGVKKIVEAILEIERIHSDEKSVEFEMHMNGAIRKSLAEYKDGDTCVINMGYSGMRFIIIRNEDGMIKLILDEKYPKDVIKQTKESGIGMMDQDVAQAVIGQFKKERKKTVTFRIGEDSDAERERVVQAVLSIEREYGGPSVKKEGSVRDKVNSALSDYFGSEKGAGFEGYGGLNRYRINPDGSIALSKYHSTKKCIEKAKELGFDRF